MNSDEELVADNTNAVLGVGNRLKAEREARGLSPDDVSQALKISRRVLDQVEANAWGQLPGHTFARGIVRGYAKFVHLDAEPLLADLASAPLPKPPLLELPQSTRTALPVAGQSQTRDRLAMIAGVVLVAIAVLTYFLVPEDWLSGRSATPATPVASEPAPVATSPITALPPGGSVDAPTAPAASQPAAPVAPIWSPVAVAPTPAAAAAPAPAPVTPSPAVTAPAAALPPIPAAASAVPAGPASGRPLLVLRFDQISWVEVRDRKGVMLLSENVPAGAERTVDGTAPLALALGNADGVRVTFRGRPVDLKPHTRQKVARLSLE